VPKILTRLRPNNISNTFGAFLILEVSKSSVFNRNTIRTAFDLGSASWESLRLSIDVVKLGCSIVFVVGPRDVSGCQSLRPKTKIEQIYDVQSSSLSAGLFFVDLLFLFSFSSIIRGF